ncbi:MAG: FAD-binding oxidoreductase, partial [Candidatus Acidiferrales bacterium]
GDGNLHPIILFDARDPEEFRRAVATADEIIGYCIEMGGSITGEHGVGMEKDRLMPLLFSPSDLEIMRGLRDTFNPGGLLNPGKVFPSKKGCGEIHARPLPVGGSAAGTESKRAVDLPRV